MRQEIDAIRQSSRRLVRELGFLRRGLAGTTLSPSAVHTLVELMQTDLTAKNLASLLLLEKSSVSRLLAKLSEDGLLAEESDDGDKRRKRLFLTDKGVALAAAIDRYADNQVSRALTTCDPGRRRLIREGLNAYADALAEVRTGASSAPPEVEIVSGYRPGCIGAIAGLHARYYSRRWKFGAAFEAKVASGLAEFIGRASRTCNEIWLAVQGDDIVGSAAIDGEDLGDGKAHLRWVIVEERMQGRGLGRRFMQRALEFSDRNDFKEIHLWTFAGLDPARALYERSGFRLQEEWLGHQWGAEVREQRFMRTRTLPR
ncbi:bifunctional helix-turn-helix transcriptional regulator/GNAT family N-acetyltransferase [Rhizobium sp. G21]|uniref:bifunctional helix-turn-helix transcriptional regulator/GNAT family N-acetyltransferase n=1 Tax=Rhizobium sp. G21 TaxID=2758439 RepID=UPI0015FEE2E2|nr:bifunctional helix-turn-helix transcriptional regulator/GNAT family N-acetyltransferase [Rhizobium sp. G21]MBB1249519.1 bifunctional helix-turn-helix transcriptional regulator/GNAT family N-acetyltransferase [Rhizobium sp. G21]